MGGGDSACEEAHYLSKLCSKVTMQVRKRQIRASNIIQDRVIKSANIAMRASKGKFVLPNKLFLNVSF